MLAIIKEYFAMQKASKWFEKNPAAQARFEDLEDWLEEVEERRISAAASSKRDPAR